jgi:hypothetical protein
MHVGKIKLRKTSNSLITSNYIIIVLSYKKVLFFLYFIAGHLELCCGNFLHSVGEQFNSEKLNAATDK